MDTSFLFELLRAEEPRALDLVAQKLNRAGYRLIRCPGLNYVVGVPLGTPSPVALVAHADTLVPKNRNTGKHLKPVELVVNNQVVTNKNGVLGADDRAGVFALLSIAEAATHKPLVVVTTGEEVGGIGVKALIQDGVLDDLLSDVRLFVEMDRAGANEYVYYSWMLPDVIHDLAQGFGYTEAQGSYSDVADLTDAYGIPHLNLSIGYYHQHSPHESLVLWQLQATMANVLALVETREIPATSIPEAPIPTYGRGHFYGLATRGRDEVDTWEGGDFDPKATQLLQDLAQRLGYPLANEDLEYWDAREDIYLEALQANLVEALSGPEQEVLREEFECLSAV